MTRLASFRLTVLAALATTATLCAPAHAAALNNGSFAQGLNSWQHQGDVAVRQGQALGLDFGASPVLVLGTASTDLDDDAPAAIGAYNVSGQSAALAGQPGGFESVLNLPTSALGSDTLEGSAAAQSFSVAAGQTVQFDWRLFTRDSYAGTGDSLTDSAWVVWDLNGQLTQTKLGDIGTLSLNTQANGWQGNSWQTVSFTATQGGTLRLGWAVGDVYDRTGTTLLAVQNVQVSAAPVPEPASLAMLLGALCVMGVVTLRRTERR